jgi:hypothetical protein
MSSSGLHLLGTGLWSPREAAEIGAASHPAVLLVVDDAAIVNSVGEAFETKAWKWRPPRTGARLHRYCEAGCDRQRSSWT